MDSLQTQSSTNIVKNKKLSSSIKRDYQLWLLILPAIVVIFIFNYIPMYGIQLAFRDYKFDLNIIKTLSGGNFRGLFYFEKFITNYLFMDLMRNTISISLTTILLGFPAPILLALLLNQIKNFRTKKILQTTVYLPHFISIVVMVGLMNVLLSPNTGIITHVLSAIGMGDINILGSTKTFVPLFVLSDIWQHCGWNSIIYLAALSSVDPQLYDSSKIDGANKWHTVWYIEIPALIPTIIILFILSMGNVLNTGFEKVFLMQNALNLPVSEVISTYTYKIGILGNQFSYSAAIGLFNTIINFVFLYFMNTISKKYSDISLW
jgi:putative aldouronate transport system permease protein